MKSEISVVIPAFNEAAAIEKVIRSVSLACPEVIAEIIVVDDGSQDDTAAIAERCGGNVVRHPYNKGHGAALKTGIKASKSDYILTMDGDGQHSATDIPRLWERREFADMVVGERSSAIRGPKWRVPGKWIIGLLVAWILGRRIKDFNSGLRLMRKEVVLRYLHACPQGFSFSTTITMILHSRGYDIAYVPIEVNDRIGKSTVSPATGLDALVRVLRIGALCNPLRVFLPVGLILIMLGVCWSIPYIIQGKGISVGGLLATLSGLIIFLIGLISDQISQLRLERFE